jgi:hypothetical protein
VNYSMYQLLGVLCSGPFPLKGASMYSRLWLEVARPEGGGALCSLEGDALFMRGEECPFRGRTLSLKDREGKKRVNLASILALFLNSQADYYS